MPAIISWLLFLLLSLSTGWILIQLGQLVQLMLKIRFLKKTALSFFGGFILVFLYLLIWHFFYAITPFTWVGLIIIAWIPTFLTARTKTMPIKYIISGFKVPKTQWVSIFGLILLLSLFYYQSLDVGFTYDALTYYFTTITWYKAYPVIPGHTNLFVYLGFNQTWFLFAALWEQTFLKNASFFLSAFLLGWFSWFQCLRLLHIINFRKKNHSSRVLFPLVSLYLALSSIHISSPAPDVAVMVITLEIIWCLGLMLFKRKLNRGRLEWVLLLGVAFVSVKLSMIGLCIGLGILWVKSAFQEGLTQLKASWVWAVLVTGFMGIWMFRGVLLSGYPLFPSPLLSVQVPWLVPERIPVTFTQYILQFARIKMHGQFLEEYAGLNWLPIWFQSYKYNISLLLFIGGILAFYTYKIFSAKVPRLNSWLILPLFSAIVFWFVSAPDPRFIVGVLWGGAALGLGLWFSYLVRDQWFYNWGIPAILLVILVWRLNRHPEFPLGLPQAKCIEYQLPTGLKVFLPENVDADDWRTALCPLPSAVIPDTALASGQYYGRLYFYLQTSPSGNP